MTFEIRCRCGGKIRTEELAAVPAPPGALLAITDDAPEEWKGWQWICEECGEQVGITYDYGKVDLGLVDDDDLSVMDVWIYDGKEPS